jgi:hypothetical protein
MEPTDWFRGPIPIGIYNWTFLRTDGDCAPIAPIVEWSVHGLAPENSDTIQQDFTSTNSGFAFFRRTDTPPGEFAHTWLEFDVWVWWDGERALGTAEIVEVVDGEETCRGEYIVKVEQL